ncbi:MAG: peptidase dimerization domain-containing protein [Candidatus Moduliflexus flocculans]|nr:peptidase dimerization domain-containing protein [Candidatus Moduliflexus flocculans]
MPSAPISATRSTAPRVGEIAYENFNAAGGHRHLNGKSVHPGSRKKKMLNSIRLAAEFDRASAASDRPELTERLRRLQPCPPNSHGTCEKTTAEYIVRNHDAGSFERQKQDFRNAAAYLNQKYGDGTCVLDIREQYFKTCAPCSNSGWRSSHLALGAIREKRSRTDRRTDPRRHRRRAPDLHGTALSEPRHRRTTIIHGPYEYASIDEMDQAVDVVARCSQTSPSSRIIVHET